MLPEILITCSMIHYFNTTVFMRRVSAKTVIMMMSNMRTRNAWATINLAWRMKCVVGA